MKKDKPSLYESIKDFKTISVDETETHIIETARSSNGTTVISRFPKHTKEEQKAIDAQIIRTLAEIAYPDVDLSSVERITLIL